MFSHRQDGRLKIFLPLFSVPGISLATIKPLTGSNFRKWRADIEIYLALIGIDHCLTEAAPAPITDATTAAAKKKAEDWLRANRMTKVILKRTLSDTVRGSVSDEGTARAYLARIETFF